MTLAGLLVTLILTGGCALIDDATASSPSDNPASDNPPAGPGASTSPQLQSSAVADDTGSPAGQDDPAPLADDDGPAALRRYSEQNELPPDVTAYIESASDDELAALTTTACGLITPDLSRSELGTVAVTARSQLSAEHQDLLDITEFGVIFGAVAGLACPDRLPLAIAPTATPLDQTAIDDYREAVPSFWTPHHPARRFVTTLTDERVHELQASACSFSAPEHSATELGTAIIAHHSAELTAEERSRIGTDIYPEVYGSLIGWFCPEHLPNID